MGDSCKVPVTTIANFSKTWFHFLFYFLVCLFVCYSLVWAGWSFGSYSSPTLLEYCVGSLTSHKELMNMDDIWEMGPTVSSPYPRRLESLTICGCNYKGSTLSSSSLSVGPAEVELTTSRMASPVLNIFFLRRNDWTNWLARNRLIGVFVLWQIVFTVEHTRTKQDLEILTMKYEMVYGGGNWFSVEMRYPLIFSAVFRKL